MWRHPDGDSKLGQPRKASPDVGEDEGIQLSAFGPSAEGHRAAAEGAQGVVREMMSPLALYNEAYKPLTSSLRLCILFITMGDNDILKRLGKNIRDIRKTHGWSQEHLAAISGIDRSFLGKVERGERNISVLTLCEIAKALGTTASRIM